MIIFNFGKVTKRKSCSFWHSFKPPQNNLVLDVVWCCGWMSSYDPAKAEFESVMWFRINSLVRLRILDGGYSTGHISAVVKVWGPRLQVFWAALYVPLALLSLHTYTLCGCFWPSFKAKNCYCRESKPWNSLAPMNNDHDYGMSEIGWLGRDQVGLVWLGWTSTGGWVWSENTGTDQDCTVRISRICLEIWQERWFIHLCHWCMGNISAVFSCRVCCTSHYGQLIRKMSIVDNLKTDSKQELHFAKHWRWWTCYSEHETLDMLVGCFTTVPVTKTIRLSEWVTPGDTAIPGMTSLKDGDLQHSSALAQSPKEI